MKKTHRSDSNSITSGFMRMLTGSKPSHTTVIREGNKTYTGTGTSKSSSDRRANGKYHSNK